VAQGSNLDHVHLYASTGGGVPPRRQHSITQPATAVSPDVRLHAFKANDGSVGLPGHVMQRVIELDQRHREFVGDDPALNLLVDEIEPHTIWDIQRTQGPARDGRWDF
jgi:hypothetical protein